MTKRYWYKVHQNTHQRPQLPDAKIVSNHFGYLKEPPYTDIEKYDLRFVDYCTTDELFDKYF